MNVRIQKIVFVFIGLLHVNRLQGQNRSDSILAKHMNPIDSLHPKIGQFNIVEIYDFCNGPEIGPESVPSLDIAYKIFVKMPCLKMEIGTYSDCRASANHNDSLTQSKAELVRNYFIKKGINPKNITAKGYGERYLLNNCACEPNGVGPGKDCTEAEHAINRRTEIKIVGMDGCK